MTYDITLKKINPVKESLLSEIEQTALQEDEKKTYDLLISSTSEASKYIDEIISIYDFSKTATEELGRSIYDVISTIFRTAIRFINDAVKWLTKKIKIIVSVRKKQKEYRDNKMETLNSFYHSLNATEKEQANRKFVEYYISYTPSYIEYSKMCTSFSSLIRELNESINLYMNKDITITAMESSEEKSKPSWITNLYDENTARSALQLFGITYEENNFAQKSPFKTMLNSTLRELKYVDIENVNEINRLYRSHCWVNLKQVVALRDKFEKFERTLKDKQRELSRNISKVDKKEIAKACNNAILSVSLSSRLTVYLTNIDEALDVRRGWLIDKAIKACSLYKEEE